MQAFVESIYEAEAATGAGSKAAKRVALERLRDNDVAKTLLMEAMSPHRVFGIKKFKTPTTYASQDKDPIIFFSLLNDLHDRVLTGNAAKMEVEKVLGWYTERTSVILRRILLKDLKAGFSAETVNEVFTGEKKPIEGAVVPLFGIMLAGKLDEKKFKWVFPLLTEAKYDGTRVVVTCEDGVCEYFSRSGKPASHLNGLFDDELAKIELEMGFSIAMDGEALASNFTETINATGSDGDEAKANTKLYAFDMMSLQEWKRQRGSCRQYERCVDLEKILNSVGVKKIIKSKYRVCRNYNEVYAFYNQMVEEGYEGLILKDMKAHYEWKRSKAWTKWKPVNTYDGRIIDFFEGKPETAWEGTLGGIIVEGEDENGVPFRARCGSGFKLPQRHEIWANKEKFLDKMVELEAQEMTISESNDVASLRFPIFKKFRKDKDQ